MAGTTGPEPATSCVTGRQCGLHSCQFGWLRGIRNSLGQNSFWLRRVDLNQRPLGYESKMIRIQVPTSTSRETYLMGIPRPGHARRDPTILNADPISALPKRLAVASASHSPTKCVAGKRQMGSVLLGGTKPQARWGRIHSQWRPSRSARSILRVGAIAQLRSPSVKQEIESRVLRGGRSYVSRIRRQRTGRFYFYSPGVLGQICHGDFLQLDDLSVVGICAGQPRFFQREFLCLLQCLLPGILGVGEETIDLGADR